MVVALQKINLVEGVNQIIVHAETSHTETSHTETSHIGARGAAAAL